MNTLDPQSPEEWEAIRKLGYKMVDDMIDYLKNLRSRKIWQNMSPEHRLVLQKPSPSLPENPETVYQEFTQSILPHTPGNVFPGFFGWVQGGATPMGMLSELLAGGINIICWGGNNVGVALEKQIIQWCREWFEFPPESEGLFVTGSSMANLMGLLAARTHLLGPRVRIDGVEKDCCVVYTSVDAHGCVRKGMELSGLGSKNIILIPINEEHQMDISILKSEIAKSKAEGKRPLMIVASAGTVGVGAIDDLNAIATICHEENMWMHVDGAFGGLGILSAEIAPKLNGIQRADSIAFDFHKWAQVPYDAGFLLVRNGLHLKQTFALSLDYLHRDTRGMSAGDWWPCDHGPDLSRSCRALKTWFTIRAYGTKAIGDAMYKGCQLAIKLRDKILTYPLELELLAPVALSLVCFRYNDHSITNNTELLDELNKNIVWDLQEQGIVAPSITTVKGKVAIRCAIINHRTLDIDIDNLIENALKFGRIQTKKLLVMNNNNNEEQ